MVVASPAPPSSTESELSLGQLDVPPNPNSNSNIDPVLLALNSQIRAQQNKHSTQSTKQPLHTAVHSTATNPHQLPARAPTPKFSNTALQPTPNNATIDSSESGLFRSLNGPCPNGSPPTVASNIPQTHVIPPTPANIASSSSLLVDDVTLEFVPADVEVSGDIHRTMFMYGHDALAPPYTLVYQSTVSLQADTLGV
ncbi:hypothetical protein BDN67DRAFT_984807 [Paxillus ammoniavirescens]|nr:hypothetical protein BDN67DRAFT_984807 [Paxillus ammoniavirescens]